MRSVIMIVYVIIGVAVAAARGYLGDVGSIGDIVNLLLAVVLWPLVLLGVEFNLNIGGGKGGGNKKGALLLGPPTYARFWLGARAAKDEVTAKIFSRTEEILLKSSEGKHDPSRQVAVRTGIFMTRPGKEVGRTNNAQT
jgi:hypothetical protein